MALLSSRYREVLEFGEEALLGARGAVEALLGFRKQLLSASPESRQPAAAAEVPSWVRKTGERFQAALDDDLDYRGALGAVLEVFDRLGPEGVGPPAAALEALGDWENPLPAERRDGDRRPPPSRGALCGRGDAAAGDAGRAPRPGRGERLRRCGPSRARTSAGVRADTREDARRVRSAAGCSDR